MIYLKAIVIAGCVALAIIFMVQNMNELSEPLQIRLNLMFIHFESTPFATYLVILLSFFAGLFAASLLGLAERFKMRRMVKASRKEAETLSRELDSLRNLPITSESMSDKNHVEEIPQSPSEEPVSTEITPEEKEALS